MKVSLVTTVKDAGPSVGGFLASIAAQTRQPDEIVVVDGGSSDETLDVLRAEPGVILIEEPGANIARGRNLAVRAATHDVVAMTDADCLLEAEWLERVLGPIESGADVAMGTYEPIAEGFLRRCMSCVNLPDVTEIEETSFMPSARSIAFRRSALEAAGGFPEWLDIGEDMYVDLRWRDLGVDMRLARDAVVHWRLRSTVANTWRQYFRYARGDAVADMHGDRHLLRFAVYAGAMLAWSSKRTWPKLATAAAGAAYARTPFARALVRFERPTEKAAALLAIPALMAFMDVAKMAGYLAGLRRRAKTDRDDGRHPHADQS